MSGYQQIGESSTSSGFGSSDVESPFLPTSAAGDSAIPVNRYETSTPINVQTEAALCYPLGPITGFIWLVVEVKNDYVRFHAWQSSLVFSCMLILHMLFFWSKFLNTLLWLADLGLMGVLMYMAWKGADDLVCFRVPVLGDLAARWVEEESQQ